MRKIICVVLAFLAIAKESSAVINNQVRRSIDSCGVPVTKQGLIVNGLNLQRGTYPWIVALMHTGWNPPKFFCGATMISKNFVVTAAHCILEKHTTEKLLPRNILAIFGAHDLSNSFEAGRILQSPKNIFVHDEWNPYTDSFDADIALLEFSTNIIQFNVYIQPICLWNSENEPTVPEGLVTGWGKSEDVTKTHENKPKFIKAPIQSNDICLPGEGSLASASSHRTFCAGLRNGSGVCFGDSGSGLFFKSNEVYYLKGIVSSSLIKDGTCDVSRYAVYTDVPKFKSWIVQKTGATLTIPIPQVAAVSQTSAPKYAKKVTCSFQIVESYNYVDDLNTCLPDQTIDSESYVFVPPIQRDVEMFYTYNITAMTAIPKYMGDKFPELKEIFIEKCGLTVLRNHYFKNMTSLQFLELIDMKIATIEPEAFRSLINVQKLWLHDNALQTLDEKLFSTMINMKNLHLQNNQIKFLSPKVFNIPRGKLNFITMEGNVCVDKFYFTGTNFHMREADLRANCAQ